MKKIFFVFIFFVFASNLLLAQEQTQAKPLFKNNTVYATFGSNFETFYMLHYDRILWRKNLWKVGANVGAAYFSEAGKSPAWSFSPGGSLLFGKTHHAELGLNYRFITKETSQTQEFLPALGYRFQRDKGGFFGSFKAGISVYDTKYNSGLEFGIRSRGVVLVGLGFTF
jgi:hypothetical protein